MAAERFTISLIKRRGGGVSETFTIIIIVALSLKFVLKLDVCNARTIKAGLLHPFIITQAIFQKMNNLGLKY